MANLTNPVTNSSTPNKFNNRVKAHTSSVVVMPLVANTGNFATRCHKSVSGAPSARCCTQGSIYLQRLRSTTTMWLQRKIASVRRHRRYHQCLNLASNPRCLRRQSSLQRGQSLTPFWTIYRLSLLLCLILLTSGSVGERLKNFSTPSTPLLRSRPLTQAQRPLPSHWNLTNYLLTTTTKISVLTNMRPRLSHFMAKFGTSTRASLPANKARRRMSSVSRTSRWSFGTSLPEQLCPLRKAPRMMKICYPTLSSRSSKPAAYVPTAAAGTL